ncbi:MAG TPA: sigma-70 family RNA polymerase sigma factor [Pyrinomonadaceae bacterium]
MFKSLLKRMSSSTAGRTDPRSAHSVVEVDYEQLVNRIIAGETAAEDELVDLFEAPVFHIIRRLAKNSPQVEDFSQDTFLTVIRKIRNGDVQQPERLPGFIVNTARYHTIDQLRKMRIRINENLEHAEEVPDPAPNLLDQLQASEKFAEIREVIGQLIPRYRELLLRFYVQEEPKEILCAELGLTSSQFDGVLHRARNRLRELYEERKGTEKQKNRK